MEIALKGELAAQLDDYLATLAADSAFSGCVLVAHGGEVVLDRGYGWADRGRTKPVTTATPFWIASISKQFTASAILKLVEQQAISLDDSIERYLANVPADKQNITIHQLLTHTAGLEQHYAADGIADRDTAIQAILAHPLARAPGEGFGYSNDAYNLLAAIIELTANQPFEDYLREQLLNPARLTHTGFWGPSQHPEVTDILAEGISDSPISQPNWGFRGAVGMFSAAQDLHRWHLALEDNLVLSEASRLRLMTPHVQRGDVGVGYGWFISQTARKTTSVWTRGYEGFGHGAVLATFPQEKVVIAITSNSGEHAPDVPVTHKLARDLEEFVFGSVPK